MISPDFLQVSFFMLQHTSWTVLEKISENPPSVRPQKTAENTAIPAEDAVRIYDTVKKFMKRKCMYTCIMHLPPFTRDVTSLHLIFGSFLDHCHCRLQQTTYNLVWFYNRRLQILGRNTRNRRQILNVLRTFGYHSRDSYELALPSHPLNNHRFRYTKQNNDGEFRRACFGFRRPSYS